MEFKQLEIKQEGNWIKRILANHTKKTVLYILIGAAAGFSFFYLTQGISMKIIPTGDILKSLSVGGFMGFFITNSPCARNKC